MAPTSDDLARGRAAAVASSLAFSSFMPVDGYAPDPFNGPHGSPGTTVTINGSGLGAVTNVTFNGVSASPINHLSDTQITVMVPTGASSGPISISDGTTTLQGNRDFTVRPPVPEITGFRPKSGPIGSTVTIRGHHLMAITTVLFHKVAADFIDTGANQELTATVPPGATTGPIVVKGPNGSASTSPNVFTVTP